MIGVEGRGGVGSFHFLGTVVGVEGEGGWVIPFSGYCDWSGGERGVGSFVFWLL